MTNKLITTMYALSIVLVGSCGFFTETGDDAKLADTKEVTAAADEIPVVEEKTNITNESDTMNANYNLRFVSPEGGVSLFVNGFLVFSEETKGNSISQMTPYIKAGRNSFELVKNTADKNATLNVIEVSEGDPMATPKLLTLSTEDATGFSVIGELTLEDDVLPCSWHKATELDNIAASADKIYAKLETLAKAMESGAKEEIMSLLTIKHKELAASVGISKDDMDTGLFSGLEAMRSEPEFSVDLVSRKNFLPLIATKGTIVNAMRTGGGHALQIKHGSRSDGFSVSLANIDGEFVIVR